MSRHETMRGDYARYLDHGGRAGWETWVARYGDNYPPEIAAPTIPPVGVRHAEGDLTATSSPSATSPTNGDPT